MPIDLAQLARVVLPGLAQNRDLSRGRRQQTFQDFDGGGLPCSVRSEQAEALARLDFQIQPADGFNLAVVGLAQVAALNGGGHPEILPEPDCVERTRTLSFREGRGFSRATNNADSGALAPVVCFGGEERTPGAEARRRYKASGTRELVPFPFNVGASAFARAAAQRTPL